MKKSSRSKNRRPQAPRNYEFKVAMMEKGRSSATTPIPSGKRYKRPTPGTRWQ